MVDDCKDALIGSDAKAPGGAGCIFGQREYHEQSRNLRDTLTQWQSSHAAHDERQEAAASGQERVCRWGKPKEPCASRLQFQE